jgi:hypothetical protein
MRPSTTTAKPLVGKSRVTFWMTFRCKAIEIALFFESLPVATTSSCDRFWPNGIDRRAKKIRSEECTEQHHVSCTGCEQSKRQRRVNLSAGDLVVDAHGSQSIRRFYSGVSQDIFYRVHKSFTTHPAPPPSFLRQLIRFVAKPFSRRTDSALRRSLPVATKSIWPQHLSSTYR